VRGGRCFLCSLQWVPSLRVDRCSGRGTGARPGRVDDCLGRL